jgi:muramoyltetrapeptide carboxypeptidase
MKPRNPTKPERLRHGDVVGIVAPSSPPPDPAGVGRSVAALERLGFKPLLGRNVRRRNGFLAGTDRERAGDLMEMFTHRKVKAIFCLRGGYGAGRLVNLLDFSAIRKNPKIFVGFSDITILHCALLTRANLVSFHGPMLYSALSRPDVPDFTVKSLFRTVMEAAPPGGIAVGGSRRHVATLRGGRASGRLIGGNLSLLCTTIGTPWQPPFDGSLLYFEDIGERPYRFDRMLTHLLNAGLLQRVAGVAIGVNADCDEKKKGREYRQSTRDVFGDRLLPLKVPVVVGLPFGHVKRNATIPVGVQATLDADQGDLILTEAAVK